MCAGLVLSLAACGGDDEGGGSSGGTGAASLQGRGPITFVTGKDRSGNLQKIGASPTWPPHPTVTTTGAGACNAIGGA